MTVIDFIESTDKKPKTPFAAATLFKGVEPPPPRRKKTVQERDDEARAKAKRSEERSYKARTKHTVTTTYVPSEPVPNTPAEDEFRHSAWKDKRKQVRAALIAAGISAAPLTSFDCCGSEAVILYCQEEQRFRVQAKFCHNRFCEPCMRAKANLLAANFRERMQNAPNHTYRFTTLTLKHSDNPLGEQIDRLYECFRELRATKMWKNNCTGGCAILEVKYIADTGEWHPHLHLIMEGDPIAKQRLSDEWYKVTGDSYVVDIKALDKHKDVAFYIGKYVAKAANREVWWNAPAAEELVRAIKGRRSLSTYGTWRGLALLEQPERTGSWTRIGTIDEVIAACNRGEAWAIRLCDKLYNELRYGAEKRFVKKPPPVV